MKILNNKTALITGASRGIGKTIAINFAKAGANIAFSFFPSAEEEKNAQNVAKKIKELSVDVKCYSSDASSFQESQELITNVLKDFQHIDILVNNAGITQDNLLLRMTEEQWNNVINVNLKSVFNLTKHIISPMLKQKGGSIINISSVVGISGNPGQSNYAASKAGIIGFTKSMAKELGARNIRCNAIAPGFIETDMTNKLDQAIKDQYIKGIPLKRFGSPDDVANTAIFLASDLGAYITGQVISVCGGMHD